MPLNADTADTNEPLDSLTAEDFSALIGIEERPTQGNTQLPVGQMVSLLLSLVVVVIAAIWVTRLIATQRLGSSSRNLKVVENLGLGGQTHLSIVQVGQQYVLLGITKEGISYLCEVDPHELNLAEVGTPHPFSHILTKYLKKEDTHDIP